MLVFFQGATHCQIKRKYNPAYLPTAAVWNRSLRFGHKSSVHNLSQTSWKATVNHWNVGEASEYPTSIFVIVWQKQGDAEP